MYCTLTARQCAVTAVCCVSRFSCGPLHGSHARDAVAHATRSHAYCMSVAQDSRCPPRARRTHTGDVASSLPPLHTANAPPPCSLPVFLRPLSILTSIRLPLWCNPMQRRTVTVPHARDPLRMPHATGRAAAANLGAGCAGRNSTDCRRHHPKRRPCEWHHHAAARLSNTSSGPRRIGSPPPRRKWAAMTSPPLRLPPLPP